MRPLTFWAAALAMLLPVSAFADASSVVVRVGSHDGYGRIAFALPPHTDYQLTQQDQHVVIQFAGDLKIGPANAIPRNVVDIKGGDRQATLDLAPGTVLHDWRYGDLLVVDVQDPGTQPATSSGQTTVAQKPDAAKPVEAKGQPTQPDRPRPQAAQPDAAKQAPATPATSSGQTTVAQKPDAAKPVEAKGQPTQPDTAKPQIVQPDAAKPAPVKPATSPGQTAVAQKPEAAQSIQAKGQPIQPDTATPQATQAGAAKPTGAKPATSSAVAQRPDAAKPAQAKGQPTPPDTAKPQTAQSDAAKPPQAKAEAASPTTPKLAPAAGTSDAAPDPAPRTNAVAPDHEQPATASNAGSASPPQPATQPVPPRSDTAAIAPSQTSISNEKSQPDAAAENTADGMLDIPADPQLGLALFQLSKVAIIVLDQQRTIDVAALHDDTVFGSAVVQTLPTATVIRVPIDPGVALAASRIGGVWRIAAATPELQLRPIQAVVGDDRLSLQAAAPGAVVGIVDPDNGSTVLVGTQRSSGQGIPVRHRTPEFTVLPTWQGVAVEPKADTIVLRPIAQGFAVVGASALSPASEVGDQLTHSIGLTRLMDFPTQPNDALLDRLRDEIQVAAATPALARGARRELVARTMMALGLGAEAGSVLRLAATDDPHLAASPKTEALTSVAALLAHRPEEASGLTDPALPVADDVVFWRAVRLAELQPRSAEAAATFGATAPLALSIPPEMRNRLLPLVAETLVSGGEVAAAAALLAARPNDESLDLARAMLAEAKHENEAALAAYERLAQSRDQSVHARAAVRAVELRLASGAINERQAADQLERLLYTWRGDHEERALRERLAELQARGGNWRAALSLLRDTAVLFPDHKAAIDEKLREMFATLLRSDALGTLPPIDLVSLVEENADLLPTGPDGEALQARLADRLLALDLPKRAGPVLEKLMRAGKTPSARAGFGARLAAVRLRENDPAEALAALEASDAPDLPDELAQRRTLLAAEANARRGDTERALAALNALDDAAADEARATILEHANDWPGAQKALAAYVARIVPPTGKLDDNQRRALLRLATAAARAGDDAALAALREREGPRMDAGPLADMFRLLTADQVRSTADLKRSGQEAAMAGRLPSQLKALQPTAGGTP